MSAAVHQRHNQGPKSNKVWNEYERLQDAIRETTGIDWNRLLRARNARTNQHPNGIISRLHSRPKIHLWNGREQGNSAGLNMTKM